METITPYSIVETEQPAKIVRWETNYNNKLGCPGMVHIDLAPSNRPTYSVIDNTRIEFRTEDQSHPHIKYWLVDIMYIKLKDIPWTYSIASHGLFCFELLSFFQKKYGPAINKENDLAIYFYHQTKQVKL